jgi:hypothetical protein
MRLGLQAQLLGSGAALHLPTRRSERGLLCFYHGLLARISHQVS